MRFAFAGFMVLTSCLCLPLPPAFAQANPGLMVQTGHYGDIGSIVGSRDCRYIASVGSVDRSVRVFDMIQDRLLKIVGDGVLEANAVVFMKDASKLVAATDADIHIIGTFDGKVEKTFTPYLGPGESIQAVAVSPDESLVAGATNTGKVIVWDRKGGKIEQLFDTNEEDVLNFVAFTPDGKHVVATGGTGARIGVFDLAGAPPRVWDTGFISIDNAALSPDGAVLAVGGLGGVNSPLTTSLWDIKTGKRRGQISTKGMRASGVAFLGDGASLQVATGNTIEIFNTKTLRREKSYALPRRISTMGKSCGVLAGLDNTGLLYRYNTRNPKASGYVGPKSTFLKSELLTQNRAGDVLIGSSVGNWIGVSLLNPNSGELTPISSAAFKAVLTAEIEQITRDGRFMLVLVKGAIDAGLIVDVAEGRVVRTFRYPGYVGSAFLLPDGSGLIVSGYESPSIVEWLKTNTKEPFPVSSISDVEFHPTRPLMAIRAWADGRSIISVWTTENFKKIAEVEAGGGDGDDLVFMPDGESLVIFSHGAGIELLDVASGKLTEPFGSFKASAGAISRDGSMIVAASDDHKIKTWDTAGKALNEWRYDGSYVAQIIFNRNDSTIVTTHGDGDVRIWSAADGSLLTTSHAFTDKNWVTQTPEGFFATSAPPGDMFAVVQGDSVIPPGSVLEAYNKPDKVIARLATAKPAAVPATRPQPSSIEVSAKPTHVVIASAPVRKAASPDAQVLQTLAAGTQVHVVAPGAASSLVGMDGTMLGFVDNSALLKLQ